MLPFAAQLGLIGPVVSCNGAYVLGPGGEELEHRTLPGSVRDKVLAFAAARGLHTNLYSAGSVFFSHDGKWADLYRARTGLREEGVVSFEAMAGMAATKILFVDSPEAVKGHHLETSKLLVYREAAITLSEAEYIEFLPPGVNKAVGLASVAQALFLHREEVAALGDYLNDLEMLRWSGFSGAVANAQPEVLEQADLLVASNDGGGAAEFIRAALSLDG
jgi:Cof subfamily protein (haloacid dehalogenase superfamily)